MQLLEWFKSHIGKKVVAKAGDTGAIAGHVHIRDEAHAEHLHSSQSSAGYRYTPYVEEEHDDVTPIVAGFLIGEMLAGSDDSGNASAPQAEAFGGGSSDGGGASGDYSDGSDSGSSDSGSSDSGSSDSGGSYDSGSSFDSGGSSFDGN